MARAVEIRRQDETIEELRALAKKCRDGGQRTRLLAIARVREGASRGEAARAAGVQIQTLRDWVILYNAQGPDGLATGCAPGPSCRLNDDQLSTVVKWLEDGPSLEVDGVVRWRCADLASKIKAEFDHDYTARGVAILLKRLGYSHISARPHHPKGEPRVREEFKKNSPSWSPTPSVIAVPANG